MGVSFGTLEVEPLSFGSTDLSSIHLGDTLIWENTPEVIINYIFRNIDTNGNLTYATGTLENADNFTIIQPYGLHYAFDIPKATTGSLLTGAVMFSNLTSIKEGGMKYAFRNNTSLTSVSFPSLTSIDDIEAMSSTFSDCTGITTVSFPSLTTIAGTEAMSSTFYDCTGITTVSFPSLTTIAGKKAMQTIFHNCSNLTSIDFSNLEQIGNETSSSRDYSQLAFSFQGCTKLTSISFPNLKKIYCTGTSSDYGTFQSNNKIQKLYFPKLNTISYGSGASANYQKACENIFKSCSSLTEIHFGAANKVAIEATSGYSTLWGRGAGNATVYFDL